VINIKTEDFARTAFRINRFPEWFETRVTMLLGIVGIVGIVREEPR